MHCIGGSDAYSSTAFTVRDDDASSIVKAVPGTLNYLVIIVAMS